MAYVQGINGKAVMPTWRHGRVMRLIRDGRAVVVMHDPFTIRLKNERL